MLAKIPVNPLEASRGEGAQVTLACSLHDETVAPVKEVCGDGPVLKGETWLTLSQELTATTLGSHHLRYDVAVEYTGGGPPVARHGCRARPGE